MFDLKRILEVEQQNEENIINPIPLKKKGDNDFTIFTSIISKLVLPDVKVK